MARVEHCQANIPLSVWSSQLKEIPPGKYYLMWMCVRAQSMTSSTTQVLKHRADDCTLSLQPHTNTTHLHTHKSMHHYILIMKTQKKATEVHTTYTQSCSFNSFVWLTLTHSLLLIVLFGHLTLWQLQRHSALTKIKGGPLDFRL